MYELADDHGWVDFSRVNLEHEIGVGSTARVYKGTLMPNGAKTPLVVAAKLFTPRELSVVDVREYGEEISLAASLEHPGIAKFHGLSLSPPSIIMLFELCPRGSLQSNLKLVKGAWSWEKKLRMAIQLAEAIVYMHAKRPPLIHRDIKPENVLFRKDWSLALSDFGASRGRKLL
jgi:serine/threonine protein kinase